VKFGITSDIYKILKTTYPYFHWPSDWLQLCAKVDLCIHEIRITRIYWSRPPPELVKLNTDGSALGNPRRIGVGGILRDCNGNLIHDFASPLGFRTKNQAELEAACIGLACTTPF